MSQVVQFPSKPKDSLKCRYDIFTIEDESLASIGFHAGDEFIIAVDEFQPGQFHACDYGCGVKVRRFYERPPNLLGRVLLPHDVKADRVPPASFLAEGAPLLWRTDATGNVTEADPRGCELVLGCSASQVLGYGFLSVLAPDERGEAARTWGECVLGGGIYHNFFHLHRADGRSPLITVAAMPFSDEDGKFAGWYGMTQPGAAIKVA